MKIKSARYKLFSDLLLKVGRLILVLEDLDHTKRYWCNDNEKMMNEYHDIVKDFSKAWLRLDKFVHVWIKRCE